MWETGGRRRREVRLYTGKTFHQRQSILYTMKMTVSAGGRTGGRRGRREEVSRKEPGPALSRISAPTARRRVKRFEGGGRRQQTTTLGPHLVLVEDVCMDCRRKSDVVTNKSASGNWLPSSPIGSQPHRNHASPYENVLH